MASAPCPICLGVGHLGPATGAVPADYGRACACVLQARVNAWIVRRELAALGFVMWQRAEDAVVSSGACSGS